MYVLLMHRVLKNNQKGFSVVEILIALSIIILLAVLTVAAFKNINTRQSLRVSTQYVYSALIDARSDTLASENDTVYGVHIDDEAVVQYAGSTYTAGSGGNVTTEFITPITATSTLSGGVTEVLFARLTGEPNATGTIVLMNDVGKTATVTIYASGLIEVSI